MATDFTNKLADASTSRLSFAPELKWGETQTAEGVGRILRFTSESLTTTPTTIISDEITSNRAVSDLSLTHYEASGDVSGEFSASTWDRFLESALISGGFVGFDRATFATITPSVGAGGGGMLRRTASGTAITGTEGTSGAADVGALKVGAALRIIETPSPTGNNVSIKGIYTIASLTPHADGGFTEIHFEEAFPASPSLLAGEFVLASQSISDASDITSGATSFSLEKQYPLGGTLNIDDKFILFQGMLVNTLNLSVASRELATLTLGFLGKNALAVESGITGTEPDQVKRAELFRLRSPRDRSLFRGTLNDPYDTPTINASSNVGGIYQDNELQSLARSITLDINNNLRGQSAIGDVANVGVGIGRSEITGTIEVYFKDLAIYRRFLANGVSSLRFILNGKSAPESGVRDDVSYAINLPRIKFSDAGQPITGNNTDIITSASFQALYDADSEASIIISRV